jgi:hypothetical protein
MDLCKWLVMSADRDRLLPAFEELTRKLEPEHGIRVRKMRRRDFRGEVARFMNVYNAAWERNWGFVPLTDAELDDYAKQLRPLLDEDFAQIAEKEGEVVGVGLSLPDFNQVLAKLNGRLLPFGWLRVLVGKRKIDMLRVFALGVKREHQHTGTAAAMYIDLWDTCLRRGMAGGEAGWILEVNEPMNRAMSVSGGEIVKRYRVYEKPLG